VTGRLALGKPEAGGANLAVAGGGLWVAVGDKLQRRSLPGGQVTAQVTLRGADNSMVAASPAGTVLLDGEAHEGIGAVAAVPHRRSVRWKASLAASTLARSVPAADQGVASAPSG
jgi:hypothetical protein